MANQRITKQMAIYTADDMKNAVYKEKLEKARAALQKEVDAFIRKRIPAPVLACVEEYKEYFLVNNRVKLFVYEKKTESGEYIGSYKYIGSKTSMPLPTTYYSDYKICCIAKECKKIIEADDALTELYTQSENFKTQIENALLSLKTEKKIKEQLPEALPYLKFPDDKSNLPVPIFSELRTMLQGIAEKKQ